MSDFKAEFSANAEEFDSIMVRMLAENAALKTKVKEQDEIIEALDNCIEWALGYDCILEPTFDPPKEDKPRYWWRKQLAIFRNEALKDKDNVTPKE